MDWIRSLELGLCIYVFLLKGKTTLGEDRLLVLVYHVAQHFLVYFIIIPKLKQAFLNLNRHITPNEQGQLCVKIAI